MRRIIHDTSLTADPALLHYHPMHSYSFLMPGLRWRRFISVFILLGLPGVWALMQYRGGVPLPGDVLSVLLLAVIIAGFLSQILINKVVLGLEELVIHAGHHRFFVRYRDIEDALLARDADEVDSLPLSAGQVPMEFERSNRDIVVLILRDGTVSRSTADVHDGLPAKYISFNLARPLRFLAFLRMRV